MPKPYVPNDAWSRKAAAEGYRARSVYKLQELDERFRLLRPGMTVLDCGAAPGSWLQYLAPRIGPKGLAIGVDLQPIAPVAENVRTLEADMLATDALAVRIADILAASGRPTDRVDLVLSDLAPKTSGIRDVDQWKSIELSEAVAKLAARLLRPKGRCLLKVLRGADFDAFLANLQRSWNAVRVIRVKATRDRSREIYVLLER